MENPEIVINDESLVVPPKKKKRVPTQKQLDALALAREKRANNVRLKKETKGKPKGQTELLFSNPEPIEIIKPVETIEEEEEEVEEVEELVEPPTPKKRATRESRKKVIKIVKRKRVKKPPKEIIYENSSSESDDEELLGEVYSYYKKELKGRKSAKIKSKQDDESSYIPEHFNLKFV
tara:strand:- start:3249 stop:3782 length:534 start_codon:yes stop_codon:yes gene_type:complete